MPKKFVVKLFKEKHKEYFNGERRLTKHRPQRTWLMIASIAEILNVSKNRKKIHRMKKEAIEEIVTRKNSDASISKKQLIKLREKFNK